MITKLLNKFINNETSNMKKVLDAKSEEEIFNLSGDLYSDNDMTKFKIHNIDWKNDKRNSFEQYKLSNYRWLSEKINSDMEYIYSFVKMNNINIPQVKRTILPEVYESDSFPTYEFRPFTPAGRIAKNTYEILFDTLDGHSNEGLTLFGTYNFDLNQEPLKVVYRFFDLNKEWVYQIDLIFNNGKREVRKIQKNNFPRTENVTFNEKKEILFLYK